MSDHGESLGEFGLYRDAFAIIIRNLIENALIHSSQDEPVHISVEKDGSIHIINGGKSLIAKEFLNVQKRFGRGTTTAPGSGLGIPIAIEMANQMQTQLDFTSPATGRLDGFESCMRFIND